MTDDIEVTLTWAEVLLAASVGVMRNVQSLRNKCDPGTAGVDDTWTRNIEGAAGELAVAKYLNVCWSGEIGNYRAADVGPYQVKTNTSRRLDDLILRDTDPTDSLYISVLSFLPRFVLCGWITGLDGKQECWLREGAPGRPAYFVPRRLLLPLAELPRIVCDVCRASERAA